MCVCAEVLLQLACSSVISTVVMQLCVIVGNDSFSTLTGAYTTYTINLRRECDGEPGIPHLTPDVVPGYTPCNPLT